MKFDASQFENLELENIGQWPSAAKLVLTIFLAIVVIGLGYVGLPLAVELAKYYQVIGFDINAQRVKELQAGYDKTLEVDDEALQKVLVQELNNVFPGIVVPVPTRVRVDWYASVLS